MAVKKTKEKQVQKINAVGRRKASVARLQLVPGNGKITVNQKDIADYFGPTTVYPSIAAKPFALTGADAFDAFVNVQGGGLNGQADAISLALSRALCAHEKSLIQIAAKDDEDEGSEGEGANALLKWRTMLKANKLLTRNARVVERKKVGFRKARKKEQYSKR